MTTPILLPLGLAVNNGEVIFNEPALLLVQKVNDGGDAQFSVLEIKAQNTTEDENLAFIRGFLNGQESFSIRTGGVFIGGAINVEGSLTAGSSTLDGTTLNLAGQVFLTTDEYNVLAIRRGSQPQTLRIYGSFSPEGAQYLEAACAGNAAKISTQKQAGGDELDLILGVGAANTIRIAPGNRLGFFGFGPVTQPALGAANAGATYGANEQDMLNKVYQALRTLGLAS